MANDRIYLRCKFCAEKILLYKYYPSDGGYFFHTQSEMDTFMAKHLKVCNPHYGKFWLYGESGFDIMTESESTWEDFLSGINTSL